MKMRAAVARFRWRPLPVSILGLGFLAAGIATVLLSIVALLSPLLPGDGDCVISFDCDGFVVVYGLILLMPAGALTGIGRGLLERNPNARWVTITLAAAATFVALALTITANDGAVVWGIGAAGIVSLVILLLPSTRQAFLASKD